LPLPHLAAPAQLANAAAAVAALHALRGRLGWSPAAIAAGVAGARIGARLQRFGSDPFLIVDVAHNPQAARMLADWLRSVPVAGRTLAVFGALGDKDVRGIADALASEIDGWFIGGLEYDSPRGLGAGALVASIAEPARARAIAHDRIDTALAAAWADARSGDRVIAFGSFFVAAAALQFAQARRLAAS
jgi:dihydrofolate synthase/folylpolyglutamate synthase